MATSTQRLQRADIQALRAVAVISVVAYHFWPNRLPAGFAGVDVFFVVSGFLITSLLVREVAATGRLSLLDFWVRRVRRIFPAAIVVIGFVIASVWLIGSPDQLEILSRHSFASAFSAENVLLSLDSVDYDRSTDSTSPLQHYWSLAVEEQFYLIWPLVIAVIAMFTPPPPRGGLRRVASITVVVICIASFVYATMLSKEMAGTYFDPFARAWELAVGAFVAIRFDGKPANPRYPPRAVVRIAWIVLIASFTIPSLADHVPGWGVAPAVLATAVVIGAPSMPRRSTARWYTRVVRVTILWLGDRSYSIYLWHWPFALLTPIALRDVLTWPEKLLAIGIIMVLSDLSYRFIENPVRRLKKSWSHRSFFVMPFAGVISALVVGVSFLVPLNSSIAAIEVDRTIAMQTMQQDPLPDSTKNFVAEYPFVTPNCEGAAASVFPCNKSSVVTYSPNSVPIRPPDSETCTRPGDTISSFDCVVGDLEGLRSIALVGDSHARTLWKALDLVGQRAGVQVHEFLHGGCPYGKSEDPQCQKVNRAVRAALLSMSFDLVVFAQEAFNENGKQPFKQVPDGFEASFGELDRLEIPFVVIRDNPVLTENQLDCVKRNFTDTTPCVIPRNKAFMITDYAAQTASKLSAQIIDFSEIYCDETTCRTAIGGVPMYRDNHHFTAVFGATLAPFLWNDLRELGYFSDAPGGK